MLTALQLSLQRYFRSLRIELDRCGVEISAYNRAHADKFNFFDYIEVDENRLSDIFANLLNPQGDHGQGERFLLLLLDRLQIPLPLNCQNPNVRREELTTYLSNSQRRIDILVDFGSFGIAIENKPWAPEQKNQLRDYFAQLERKYLSKFILLYFSSVVKAPKSISTKDLEIHAALKQYQRVAFSELALWITDCAQICQADKVKWFLLDFAIFMRQRFPDTSI